MKFSESLVDGCVGEYIIWNLLVHKKDVKSVVDVRDDINFQQKDVDFLVENRDRQFTWVEVKTDFMAHETGNIVYEKTTSGNIGCFEKTQAKLIYYYLPMTHTCYVISVSRLRKFIEYIKPPLKRMGDNAEGYLLNIQQLIENNVILKTEENVR